MPPFSDSLLGDVSTGRYHSIITPWVCDIEWNNPVAGVYNVSILDFVFGTRFNYAAGPAAYNPGTGNWEALLTCNDFFNGGSCLAALSWRPETFQSEQVTRAFFDELTAPVGGQLLRWEEVDGNLPGAVARQITNGGQLWAPDHVRGLTFELFSQSAPRAPGQLIRWVF